MGAVKIHAVIYLFFISMIAFLVFIIFRDSSSFDSRFRKLISARNLEANILIGNYLDLYAIHHGRFPDSIPSSLFIDGAESTGIVSVSEYEIEADGKRCHYKISGFGNWVDGYSGYGEIGAKIVSKSFIYDIR